MDAERTTEIIDAGFMNAEKITRILDMVGRDYITSSLFQKDFSNPKNKVAKIVFFIEGGNALEIPEIPYDLACSYYDRYMRGDL